MATPKKEFPIKFHKDVNAAWCGSAYFINKRLNKKTVISVAGGPHEKKTISVSWIKERLTEYEEEMRHRHPDWVRVTVEEYDNFNTNI